MTIMHTREIATVPRRTRRKVFRVGAAVTAGILMVALPCVAQQLTNDALSLTVNAQEGSYQLSLHDSQPVLRSRVAAQVDHQWLRSSDYPRHQASESTFEDDLGPGRVVTVICSGLDGKPDLVYVLQLYKQRPYGTVQVKVQNSVSRSSIWVAANQPSGLSPTVSAKIGRTWLSTTSAD